MDKANLIPTVVCNRRGSATLCGVDVPPEMRALVVERTTCPNGRPECGCKPVISIVAGVDAGGVARALSEFGGCVEVAYGQLLMGDQLLPTLENQGLYMALSTKTAYSTEPAHLFCAVLAEKLKLDDVRRDRIELAVHEAVANGLLHGNLRISSEDRATLEGFRRYCRKIEDRLQDPVFAGRLIEVGAVYDAASVIVTVCDNGAGYDVVKDAAPEDPERKSGRGLRLIREMAADMAVSEGGRRVTMRFLR